jgi:hypothetical protein
MTESNALELSILSRRQEHFLAWSSFANAWTNLKLS